MVNNHAEKRRESLQDTESVCRQVEKLGIRDTQEGQNLEVSSHVKQLRTFEDQIAIHSVNYFDTSRLCILINIFKRINF